MKVLVCVLALLVGALGAPKPESRIIGGWDAVRGQFPTIVSLDYCLLNVICQHTCGGTIIAPTWVVTAGHCITDVPLPTVSTYYVIAGILEHTDNNPERQRIRVAQTIIHPDYAGGVNPHDIALFRLESPLSYNIYVQPSVLPTPGQEFTGEVVLAGWGSISGSGTQAPNRLQTVDLPLLPVHDCNEALTSILQGGEHPLDLDSNICTGPLTGGISACSGDSGGPLHKDNIVIGIVSWGVTPCGSVGAPTVYNKVSYNTFWIRETTGIN